MKDPLEGLPRLGTDALGPCVKCDRVMLAAGSPLFLRFRVQRCGIDRREVDRHVGLAQSIAPGRDGLALASIMGPEPKPVVVMDEYVDANVCADCAARMTAEDLHLLMMAREPAEAEQ